MPKERNKADGYREKAPIKREKSDVFIDSSEREVSRPKVKAYEGDTKAMNNLGVCYERGTGVPVDEKKGLKWIHKATFQGYQPAIDYCKEHNIKWY